jgi:hypothetical protein
VEAEMKEKAVEAVMGYQLRAGNNVVPLYIWHYDALKYGSGILSTYWDEDYRYVSRIELVPTTVNGFEVGNYERRRVTEKITKYKGNRFWNIRPHDFLPDPRVPLNQVQRGEYCGWSSEVSWSDILLGKDAGTYMNIEELEKGTSEARKRDETHLDIPEPKLTLKFAPVGFVSLIYLFVRLVPAEWGLGSSRNPEKWVFTIANRRVIIQARPYGEYHDNYPIFVIEPEFEGYYEFSRSRLETVEPMQDVISWLLNSHFHNVRKTLNDMFIVDPSKVEMTDLLNPQPGKLIRTKPLFWGQNLDQIIRQFPVTDVTRSHTQDSDMMMEMAQRILGTNDPMMGVLQQGGRKSATEIRTTTSLGTNRMKVTSQFCEVQGMQKLGQVALQITQQYYDDEMEFKLLRDKGSIRVAPQDIAGQYDFITIDGNVPLDNISVMNVWKEILLQGMRIPNFMQVFDPFSMLTEIAKLAGLNSIDRFRAQVTPQAPGMAPPGSVPIGELSNALGISAGGPGQPIRGAGAVPNIARLPGVGALGGAMPGAIQRPR